MTDTSTAVEPPPIPSSLRLTSGLVVAAVQMIVVWFMPLGWSGAAGLVVVAVAAGLQAVALWRQVERPMAAAAVVIAAAGVIQLVYPPIAGGGALPALFALASMRRPRVSLWGLAAVMTFAPFQAWAEHWRAGLIMACSAALAWALGELNRNRVVRRREEARRIADAERARIASDLHDVVAHHVSVVVVQAAAGHDIFDSHPERARSALLAIETTGRQALAELRRVVRTLPQEIDAAVPGLADIDDLVASVRAAGVSVELRRDPVLADEEVALTAHRLVQESLTNVVRHAKGHQVDIAIYADGSWLRVDVDNVGPKTETDSSGTGRGIRDMRRRVRALGGSFDAGANERGFTVRARLPLTR